MSKYSGYIERLEQDEKKKRLIIGVVVGVLVLIFMVGCVWGLRSVLNAEGTLEVPPELPASLTQEADILTYVSDSLKNTAGDGVLAKVKKETYFEIDKNKISVGDSEADNALERELAYAGETILENVKKYDIYATIETSFGEDITGLLVPVLFTEDEADISIEVGKKNDEGVLKNTDKYYFKAVFGEYKLEGMPAEIEKSFDFDNGKYSDLFSRLDSDFSSVAEVLDSDIICKSFEISGDTDIETGRINGICYSRLYYITLRVKFTGELAALGEKDISFPLSVYEIHSFSYAGIKLDARELWLKKGGTEVVGVTKTHGDGEMSVAFESSDESVVKVDSQGYVKGVSYSDKPVTVTVTAQYLGQTYKEECTVYVRHEVDGVELEEDAVKLAVGESKTLVSVFEPKAGLLSRAPEFTGVKWYVGTDADGSSYSDTVKINEDGTVTVIGDNEAHYAEVFCVSDDGHYKATCEITITG